MTDPRPQLVHLRIDIDTRPLAVALHRLSRLAGVAGVALTAWQRVAVEQQLRLDLARHRHVLVRGGRRMHKAMVRPPQLCIDGHAYRNRTRRRTRRNR